jgi:hypothetical protein
MNDQMDIFTEDGCADGRSSQDGYSRPEASEHGASGRWLWPATREHGSAVLLGQATEEELDDLRIRGLARRRPDPLPRNVANQAVLDGWVSLLSPHFDGDSVNLTGTYSDGYGYSHGLMLPRNVMTDFARAIEHERPGVFLPRCIGVEEHNSGRAVLHFHAMVGGVWSEADRARLEAYWLYSRGWAKAKAVSASGGCVGYCAKHLLKRGAADNFDFQLAPRRAFLSRHDKRVLDSAR